MPRVIANLVIAPNLHRMTLEAPRVAKKRLAGQFVIVRLGDGHERIPLTIAEADPVRGTIDLVIQAVGAGTKALVAVPVGGDISDVCGPLGQPTHLVDRGHAVCVGGGVGTAVVMPIAQALHARGVKVTSVVGGRTSGHLICLDDLARFGDVRAITDDGSSGRKGVDTEILSELIVAGDVDIIYAVGPVPMMRAVANLTRPLGIHTVVSLNPVMVDGTGMCGGCRVLIDGKAKFACVDGPEFDAHQVDFDVLVARQRTYKDLEREADAACRIGIDGPCSTAAAAR
jgi:ferredoxin--NADP+ reductase